MGEERFSGGLWIHGDTGDYLPAMPIQEINEITDSDTQTGEMEPVYRIDTDWEVTGTVKTNTLSKRSLRKLLIPSWWRLPIRWRMRQRARKLKGRG